MRGASIVGPLLLIAIGALFLARNIFPELPMLDYLARYWPFLLIGWGSLRLLEILFWAATSKPLPVHGISGGEWTLVALLCLFGLTLHAARGLSTWLPRAGIEWGGLEVFGESYEYPFRAEAPSSPTPRVVIENFRGSARIMGTDENMVKVSGRTIIRAMDRAMADRAHADTDIEISSAPPDQVVIRPHNSDVLSRNRRIRADMDITVPRGATVVARGRDGDFDVSGINGAVEITSTNSSTRLEDIGGEVRLDVNGGDMIRGVNLGSDFSLKGRGSDIDLERVAGRVNINGTYTGLVQFRELARPWHWVGPQTEITAQGLPGELRMTLGDMRASNIAGPVRIQSTSKDVQLNGFTDSLDLTINRGDLALAPGTQSPARMNVRVQSGDVELTLAPGARFELNAETDRGDAINDYGDPLRREEDGRRARIRGSTGGAPIDISVDRGRILVRRAAGDSVSAARVRATVPSTAPPRPVEQ
jgi:DUF4097 and DUF4098 domain-containing protein YvlB